MFVSNLEYPEIENEHYRRCWTKDINHYYSHYNNVDILLAPLEMKEFNYVKSELKVIECCFSNTAIIASNYGPYELVIKNALTTEGEFDETGNGILIDEDKNETDWVKAIELLVNNPEKLKTLQNNVNKDFKDTYSLSAVTEVRKNFYKEITQFKKE